MENCSLCRCGSETVRASSTLLFTLSYPEGSNSGIPCSWGGGALPQVSSNIKEKGVGGLMVGIGRTWSEASSFPSDKTGKNCDFAQVLKRSICLEQNTQAWCDNCEKYQPTVSGRLPWARVLPHGGLSCGLIRDRLGQHAIQRSRVGGKNPSWRKQIQA